MRRLASTASFSGGICSTAIAGIVDGALPPSISGTGSSEPAAALADEELARATPAVEDGVQDGSNRYSGLSEITHDVHRLFTFLKRRRIFFCAGYRLWLRTQVGRCAQSDPENRSTAGTDDLRGLDMVTAREELIRFIKACNRISLNFRQRFQRANHQRYGAASGFFTLSAGRCTTSLN